MIEIIERYNQEYQFSDIHLKEDKPIMLRIDGDIMIPDEDIVSSAELQEFANDKFNYINCFGVMKKANNQF